MRMRQLTTTTDPADFLGMYGQTWRQGLISDHLDLFVRAGGEHRPSAGPGAGWAVVPTTDLGVPIRVAYPVLCSEIVRIDTEDGPVSGRCGANALAATGTCDRHDPR